MAVFNAKNKQFKIEKNKAGGVSYKKVGEIQKAKQTVANIILTHKDLNTRLYYHSDPQEEISEAIKTLLNHGKAKYVLKAIAFARNVGALRSISHFSLIEYFSYKGNKPSPNGAIKYIQKTLVRPDDATEILAGLSNIGKIPNAFRRAVKKSLEEDWDAYQLRKYYGDKRKAKVSDLIKLSHPVPKNTIQAETFNRAVKGKRFLQSIETAQTVNTSQNTSVRERSLKYLEMLKEKKLGYMALLKNLVNIAKGLDKEEINVVKEALEVEKAIIGSKVLPYRFLQSYIALQKSDLPKAMRKELVESLEKAILTASKNVLQKMGVQDGEKLHFIIDVSGSMEGEPLMHAVSLALPGVVNAGGSLTLFGTCYETLDIEGKGVFEIFEEHFNFGWAIAAKNGDKIGWGTNIRAALDAIKTNVEKGKDSVIVFSDMQLYDIGDGGGGYINQKGFDSVFKGHLPKVTIFWDVQPYNTGLPVKADFNRHVYSLAGVSQLFYEYLDEVIANGGIVNVIEKYTV